jgi:hypothetical protein
MFLGVLYALEYAKDTSWVHSCLTVMSVARDFMLPPVSVLQNCSFGHIRGVAIK